MPEEDHLDGEVGFHFKPPECKVWRSGFHETLVLSMVFVFGNLDGM